MNAIGGTWLTGATCRSPMLPGVLRKYSDPADGWKIVRGGTWRARKVLVLFPQQIRAQRARLGRVGSERAARWRRGELLAGCVGWVGRVRSGGVLAVLPE